MRAAVLLLALSALAPASAQRTLPAAFSAATALAATHARRLAALVAALPARAVTQKNVPAVPLNLVFLGTRSQIEGALSAAGWTEVPLGLVDSFEDGLHQLRERKKITLFPPLLPFFVYGRAQVSNWAQVVRPLESRHHLRLWQGQGKDARGRAIWPGATNFDAAIDWRQLDHYTAPDIDAERAYVERSLAGLARPPRMTVVASAKIPRRGTDSSGNPFQTDGGVLVVEFPPAP